MPPTQGRNLRPRDAQGLLGHGHTWYIRTTAGFLMNDTSPVPGTLLSNSTYYDVESSVTVNYMLLLFPF